MKMVMAMVCFFMLIVTVIGYAIVYSPCLLQPEYSTSISVETPDKIENAISNAVSDLEKRDFVPVELEVKWYPARKTYAIYVWGIDRTRLGKYEP